MCCNKDYKRIGKRKILSRAKSWVFPVGKIVKDAKFSRKNKYGEHDLYENENEQLKLSDNDKLGF